MAVHPAKQSTPHRYRFPAQDGESRLPNPMLAPCIEHGDCGAVASAPNHWDDWSEEAKLAARRYKPRKPKLDAEDFVEDLDE